MVVRRITSLFLLLGLCATSLHGDSTESSTRPTVGLVLGGGGALGIAHVGVLKELEEMRVPIDYIGGTSMGAIIAGLYASGMSPTQIEDLLVGIDWWDVLKDRPARRDLDFRRKQDDAKFLLDIDIGLNHWRLTIPGGLSSGQKLITIMQRETAPVASIDDFNSLNIPYRAVATDLTTGEAVILDHGSLAQAMRASMAVPGVFTPVIRDDQVLVDGGVVNNVPVDVVKAMGADIIIAVDVGELKARELRKNLTNLGNILGQTYLVMQRKEVQAQMEDADITILPDLAAFSPTGFEKAAQIIPKGTEATRQQANELGKLSVSEDEFDEYLRNQRLKRSETVEVTDIAIEGNDRVSDAVVLSRIKATPDGETNLDTVQRDVARIYGMGDFLTVTYDIQPETNGNRLSYVIQEKPWGPGYVRFGLRIETDLDKDSTWQFLADYTRMQANRLGAEFRLQLEAGDKQRIYSEFYQPLTPSALFFVAPRLGAGSEIRGVYDRDDKIAEYDIDSFGGALDAGIQVLDSAELRAGVFIGTGRAQITTGDRSLPEFDGGLGAFTASFTVDRLDASVFPRHGGYLRTEAYLSRPALGGVDVYDKGTLFAEQYISAGERHTFSIGVIAASSFGSDLPPYDEFTLGGTESLAGLSQDQVGGKYAGLLQIGYRFEVTRLPPAFGDGVYVVLRQDTGNAWRDRDDSGTDDLRYGGAAAIAADTVFGPMIIGYAVADGGNRRAFLSVGTIF